MSVPLFNERMSGRSRLNVAAERREAEVRRALGSDLRRLRLDAGISQAALSRASGISRAEICRLEKGERSPAFLTLALLAEALDADLSVRLLPGAGIPIRDRFQARMIETLLATLHPRWTRFPEVPVRTPARGVVDLVIGDRTANLLVAVEAESGIRRLEQQLRWANEKAMGLASTELAALARADPDVPVEISQLLLLRSTRGTRQVVQEFGRTVAAAYPAPTRAVLEALSGSARPWPGPGIVWVSIDGRTARLMDGPPRGVSGGR